MTTESKDIAQVHRFGDKVAIWTGGGTLYLSPTQALALAEAIKATAESVTTEPNFAKSTIGTFWLKA
jgi:hypothetical protein